MGLPHVTAIDDVAPVDEAGRDDQLVDIHAAGVLLERRRDLRAHVATQHRRRAEVAGVATVAGHVAGVVTEAIVVVAHRDDGRVAHVSDGAAPCVLQRRDDGVEKQLDRVAALSRVGEVAQGERVRKLICGEVVGVSHDESP